MNRLSSRIQLLLVVMMSLVAVFSLTSGVGTTCIAWGAENWKPFAKLAAYASTYQAIVIATLIVGFAASIITYAFIRGEKWAYLAAIITVVIGLGFGIWHVNTSMTARGSATPGNLKVYVDALALIVLLIIRIPGIWNKIDLTKPMGKNKGSFNNPIGMAFSFIGLGLVTTPLYAGGSHTFDGVNYVDYLLPELYIYGGISLLVGFTLILLTKFDLRIERGLGLIWQKAFGNKA